MPQFHAPYCPNAPVKGATSNTLVGDVDPRELLTTRPANTFSTLTATDSAIRRVLIRQSQVIPDDTGTTVPRVVPTGISLPSLRLGIGLRRIGQNTHTETPFQGVANPITETPVQTDNNLVTVQDAV
jgi:hypothetical protein